ncbi:Uncharacterized protein dnm_049920 [Desulfonema magnum]|uniref:Uncharacterized protein n=1 Tax=Desulfonema magnum TaxID=45655 RepID=A0A975BPZ8_9BACT|nr:Uncharacterized protein dnm_049920 [Desulfonema magnum]
MQCNLMNLKNSLTTGYVKQNECVSLCPGFTALTLIPTHQGTPNK